MAVESPCQNHWVRYCSFHPSHGFLLEYHKNNYFAPRQYQVGWNLGLTWNFPTTKYPGGNMRNYGITYLLPQSSLYNGNYGSIQIDAHALIDPSPLHHQPLGTQNEWNWWFVYQKAWVYDELAFSLQTSCSLMMYMRSDFDAIIMNQFEVLITLNMLLFEWIWYTIFCWLFAPCMETVT